MNIAILGATGQIAQSVLYILSKENGLRYHLFARNKEKLELICQSYPALSIVCHYGYDDFHNYNYDVIINGISIGTHDVYKSSFSRVWTLTEQYDNMIISYLETYPSAKYINFSSGAAYGGDFALPADDNTLLSMDINHFQKESAYAMAKAASECKHRSFTELNIIDLRIFAFYNRFVNLDYRFLLCDIIRAARSGAILRIGAGDIMRDYIHPADFRSLLLAILKQDRINTAVDVVSKSPIRKSEILDFFQKHYGLHYTIDGENDFRSVTGLKPNYYSLRKNKFYMPDYTSLDCIRDETPYFLDKITRE